MYKNHLPTFSKELWKFISKFVCSNALFLFTLLSPNLFKFSSFFSPVTSMLVPLFYGSLMGLSSLQTDAFLLWISLALLMVMDSEQVLNAGVKQAGLS